MADQNGADRGKDKEKQAIKKKLTPRQKLWTKVEASLWVLAASFLLFYGDGDHNFIDVLLHDIRVWR